MLKSILQKIYALDNRRLRNAVLQYIANQEGGQPYSVTIRNIIKAHHRIDIGMYSYGGCFTVVQVPDGTHIGRYCSFASAFTILNGNHPAQFKSLHPFFYNPIFGYVDDLMITRSQLIVDNDVWVGHAAIILPSVTHIGNGAIIGAGCVVTENVPPYAIVIGNPGRVIKYRFDVNTIEKIQESKWWEKDIRDIKANAKEFSTFTRDLRE